MNGQKVWSIPAFKVYLQIVACHNGLAIGRISSRLYSLPKVSSLQ